MATTTQPSMNAVVQKALDNLETNLQTLIESIASYNHSVPAAISLVQADIELDEALEKLQEHQDAHQRIVTLNQTTDALDEQIKELLSSLAETRQQVLTLPSAGVSAPQVEVRDVSYADLLAYASRISKFSQPPNPAAFRKLAQGVLRDSESSGGGDGGNGEDAKPPPLPLGLSEEDMQQLDASSMMPFTPWPSEELMKVGALAALGPDGVPEDMLPDEERLKKVRKEEEKEKLENGAAEEYERRRMSYPVAQPKRESVMDLSLDLYDPDAE